MGRISGVLDGTPFEIIWEHVEGPDGIVDFFLALLLLCLAIPVIIIYLLWQTKIGRIFVIFLACAILLQGVIAGTKAYLRKEQEKEMLLREIDLEKLEIIDGEDFIDINEWNTPLAEDYFGNQYESSYYVLSVTNNSDLYWVQGELIEEYADIATNGEYMYLSGTVFCNARQHPDHKMSFKVYADGVLVYDSGEMSRDTEPKHIKVCINNAQVIRIQSTSHNYPLTDRSPSIILVNAKCTDE